MDDRSQGHVDPANPERSAPIERGTTARPGTSGTSDTPGASGGATAAAVAAAENDALYRTHYERFPSRPADVPYERARPAYELGGYARRNPDYAGRPFTEIEPDLRARWTDEVGRTAGEWETVRPLVRAAYEGELARERGATFADENLGGTASHQRPSYSDPIPRYVDPVDSSTGQYVAGSRDPAAPDEDPWVRDPVDQGGFGSHPSVPLKREHDDRPAT
jgi:hypothetical protein